MKTALFVDFDNAYLGLERLSSEVALRFGQGPRQWLRWLTEEFPSAHAENGETSTQRRVLIRRCYLNPVSFARFRRPFLEAGFDIVDCPPMTAAGKTSTDVHMVLDMVDALMHPTGFDEFIVFSADADFSPVLRRLRTNNRRTVVFAAGNMSEAYRASADVHIDVDNFIYDGLGHPRPSSEVFDRVDHKGLPLQNQTDFEMLRLTIAVEVERIVKTANDPVPFSRLAAELNRKFGNLAESKWLGAGTFSDLLTSLNLQGITFDRNEQSAIDLVRMNQQEGRLSAASYEEQQSQQPRGGEDIISGAIGIIHEEVSNSLTPTKFARMASILDRRFPSLRSNWLGHKTFSGFVASLDLGELRLARLPNSADRVIYDPTRHAIDSDVITNPLIASIFQVAKLPQICAIDFCGFLNVFWATLEDQSFDIAASSNKIHLFFVREESTPSVPLSTITSLLQGLIFGGFDPRRTYDTAEDLKIDACGVVLAAWARENLAPYVDNETRIQFMNWVNDGEHDAIRPERPPES